MTPRTSCRWQRARTERAFKVTALLSVTQRPKQICGRLPACPAGRPDGLSPAADSERRVSSLPAAVIYRAEPLVLGWRWKRAVPAGFGGAGSAWAPRGNLKRGDRSSYRNLLEPPAFGVNSQRKIALSFGKGRSRRDVFHLPLFSPSVGISTKSFGWGCSGGWAGEVAAGTISAGLAWTRLWGRAAVSQQRRTPGWNRKAKKMVGYYF